MFQGRRFRRRAPLWPVVVTLAALTLVACARVNTRPGPPADAATGETSGGGGLDASPGGSTDLSRPSATDAGQLAEAGCHSGVTCTPMNGRYCGVIGDGCAATLDCGACPGDQVCDGGLCVAGTSCVPLTCAAATGRYCGSVGNGCGKAMDCGACPAGQTCTPSGLCVSAGCVPTTCDPGVSRYCGTVGDGCGGRIECGACAAPATCGGTGVPGVCGEPGCKKVTCTAAGGGQYCGRIGDGCGGVLDCPTTCPAGACGTAGAGGVAVANVCPGTGTAGGCSGIACNVPKCTAPATTSISGTVRDPAGKLPLYNAVVYVPNAALDPVPEGVSCDRCSVALTGRPIATALTDTNGRFVLSGVPAGDDIPVVIQLGKWRREIIVPTVAACVDNPITDADQTRLPRTKAEGHLPRIAVTTGGADALECLLRRIGIADSEFTTDGGTGRVHLFAGGKGTSSFMAGGTFAPATALWSNRSKLNAYDMVVLSCEGSTKEFADQKPQTSIDNVASYASAGGRLFVSHLHFYWLQNRMPDFSGTASYLGNLPMLPDPATVTINQTFPKGMALARWLNGGMVGATTTLGQMQVSGSEHSVTMVNPPTTEWVFLASNPNDGSQQRRSSQYLSFNTPVGTPEANQCGKVVFTDIHIQKSIAGTGGDDSAADKPFPSGCKANETSPQGKALEFLFFDLSACVLPDTTMPVPPPVPPPGIPTTPPPATSTPPPVPPPPPPPPPPPIP